MPRRDLPRSVKRPTKAQIIAARKFWKPRHPEVAEKCASCPFRAHKEAEALDAFHEVLDKIAEANGAPRVTRVQAILAIRKVMTEDAGYGEFMCHHSVYEPGFESMRPQDQRRQCKGASEHYRNAEGM